jgi:2'-5' RNA ligase
MGGSCRLFVAAYPPPEVAERLLLLLDSVAPPRDLKRVNPPDIHLTLQFIGEVLIKRVDEVSESVRRACSGAAAQMLTPRVLRTLPTEGPVRLVAVVTDWPPVLAEVQKRLAMRLANPRQRARGEVFLPHFTLARFAAPVAGWSIDDQIEVPAFKISEVCLVQSSLNRDRAMHRVIDRVPLP